MTGRTGQTGRTNPRLALVTVARSQIGVRETSRNAAAEILKYWQATDYPTGMANREPWCAAFVAWVIFDAMKREPLLALGEKTRPRSARVLDWLAWGLEPKHGVLMFGSRDSVLRPEAGDIVIFTFSHMGVVEGCAGGVVRTIEGNTDDEGSREGFKVCRRERKLDVCRTFLRLACKGRTRTAMDGRKLNTEN